jgi:hypothetical protein
MKSLYTFSTIVFFGLLGSCGSADKNLATAENSKELEQLITGKTLRFEAEWAQPLVTNSLNRIGNAGLLPAGSTASRINLIGNYNFLLIKGDSVEAHLPYYGERQMAAGYNSSDNGISFKGVAQNMEVSQTEKPLGYRIQFTIPDRTESFQVKVQIYSNLRGVVNINSSHRHPIRYDGKVTDPEKNLVVQYK